MFIDICEEMKLNWRQHLVGQSFDGAASMRALIMDFKRLLENKIQVRYMFGVMPIVLAWLWLTL